MKPLYPLTLEIGDTLVNQLVLAFKNAILEKKLHIGAKLPSIRQCARIHRVSSFTIAEVYSRLVAEGVIQSKNRSGYFVKNFYQNDHKIISKPNINELPIDDYWLLKNIFEQANDYTHFSCGWLPSDWYPQNEIAQALRAVSKQDIGSSGYGDPYGYLPLRQFISHHLLEHSINNNIDNILLTQGASRALDMVSNTFLSPGETVFVDDPGYCNFLSSLIFKGMRLISIPWLQSGPDIQMMENILKTEKPRFYFTNPWLQNPTGATLSFDVAYKVLSLAERYNITIVEDNVSGDLMSQNSITLASLGGLDRVIHIKSYCKTLQPNLRVGYIAANRVVIKKLVHYKMMTALTSSEISERVVLAILKNGNYRKHIDRLRSRLAQAQLISSNLLKDLGWELFTQPETGLYLYAKPKNLNIHAQDITEKAKNEKLLLAPGQLFSPQHRPSPWIRFNVAYTMLQQNILKNFLLS